MQTLVIFKDPVIRNHTKPPCLLLFYFFTTYHSTKTSNLLNNKNAYNK